MSYSYNQHDNASGDYAEEKPYGEKGKSRKYLATAANPIIAAVLEGHYSFRTRTSAEEKLAYIQENFVRSTYGQEDDTPRTIIWIRGYDVTEEEEAAGCIGNYAIIYVNELSEDTYTLSALKVIADPRRHPQRRRKKNRHPDWGYWVMRRINKGWRYDSIDEAYSDLMTLTEDYPLVTIPSQNKVLTILYQRPENEGDPALRRVILEVEALHEGGFTIVCKDNNHKPKESKVPKVEAEAKAAVGRFTSMVQVKQNRRKNIADFKPAQEAEEQDNES
jgi:hypothetical protein